MIKLNRNELKDKIHACWIGKNIGGTIGTPFENTRHTNDITGFNSEPGNPLPNDDLDLQLIWLKAMMDCGPKGVNERVLGEYWQEYISPYWNEYGVGKGNMVSGLVPPLSGQYDNEWKHSNGAWIRTEIWACLYPGIVEEAIKYSFMDACVDHGYAEGTFAAIFVEAMQCSAFVISDLRKLIEIGLSKIPESCKTSKYIKTAVEAYDSGKTWLEARNILTEMALADPELGWFQAPTNVGYTIIALLYGEGDFKKTLITAVNCGDDTDCTAATAGALLGIMHGMSIIPEDWEAYIGDKIITVAVNRGAWFTIPNTCTEFTDIILGMHQVVLKDMNVTVYDGEPEAPAEDIDAFSGDDFSKKLAKRSEYSFNMEFILSKVEIDYDRAPDITPFGQIGIKVAIENKFLCQKHFQLDFIVPEGWEVTGGKKNIYVKNAGYEPTVTEFVLTAGEQVEAKNRVILEISCEGHSEVALIPMVFLG